MRCNRNIQQGNNGTIFAPDNSWTSFGTVRSIDENDLYFQYCFKISSKFRISLTKRSLKRKTLYSYIPLLALSAAWLMTFLVTTNLYGITLSF